MLWLTYRQHRIELGVLVLAAAATVVALLVFAERAAQMRAAIGIDACGPVPFTSPECGFKLSEFNRQLQPLTNTLFWLFLFPAFVAAFLGGPLFAREFERGTHRLVWTQGITRMRWTLEKLGIVLGVVIVAAALMATVGGRVRGLQSMGAESPFSSFDVSAPVVIAYFAFALTFGAAMGALVRRSVTAMLAGLIGFVAIRVFVAMQLRPYFVPPIAIRQGGPPADAWNLGVHQLTAAGAEVPQEKVNALVTSFYGPAAERFGFRINDYFAANDVYTTTLYQPADRYWLFQSIETAIFLMLIALCIALTLWVMRR